MNRFFKEPLLHFLLLGAAVFAAYSLLSKRSAAGTDEIVVTMGQVEHLAAGFAKTWQRPPTAQELAALVQDRVREEVYCREALALGLDQEDTVIRRRLRQKMEFISEDLAAQLEPSEADLQAYLQAHPDVFRLEPVYSFRQVYVNPENHGEQLAYDLQQLLVKLNRTESEIDAELLGESLMLDYEFSEVPAGEIAKQFGQDFAASLRDIPFRIWSGPVESGYGVHLVWISERSEGRLPELAQVRASVAREWSTARRLEVNEQFYRSLLERYSVRIEGLEQLDARAASAAQPAQ
jgi:hypothetical protein